MLKSLPAWSQPHILVMRPVMLSAFCMLFALVCADNAQVKALKAEVKKAQQAAEGPPGEADDAFAGFDTPKSQGSPAVRKLCMVCMDTERRKCHFEHVLALNSYTCWPWAIGQMRSCVSH